MAQHGIQGSGLTSQSGLLASRYSVKPTDPGYDAHVLAHIKAKVIIDAVTGCWLWQGFVHAMTPTKHGFSVGGYGTLGYRGRNTPVHRAVWAITKGPIPPKMDVCHTCDVRHCCNPDHLWLGTRRQNLQDMVNKRRGPCGEKAAKMVCDRGHPLTGEHIYTYDKHRRCKRCDQIRGRLRSGWPADLAETLPPLKMGYTWQHYLRLGAEVLK